MIDLAGDFSDVPCPRCRTEATWRFLDEAKSLVEVVCLECGTFEMPRTEFEQAEADVIESAERE